MNDLDTIEAPTSPTSRKRPLEDEASPHSSALSTAPSYTATPTSNDNGLLRATSPSLSSSTSISGDPGGLPPTANAVAGAVPQKRRKLTFAEKEQQRLEKEAKAKDRAEAKAKRDEEKRLEEEEKQKKRAEKEEKKKQREFEAQQKKQEKDQKQLEKDQIKQKEEEEKQKKERSQLRLNAFFVKPKNATTPNASPHKGNASKGQSASPTKGSTLSEWDRFFLPFCLPQNATMSKRNNFIADDEDLEELRERVEAEIATGRDCPMDVSEVAQLFKKDLVRPTALPTTMPVEQIVARLRGSSDVPIDLTDEESAFVNEEALRLLRLVPLKYLHFDEDVRPPYYGTFTQASSQDIRRLARDPFKKAITELNYDYDSEAEWVEDASEGGEDIGSEIDEEESEDGDDNMEEFLDDEEEVMRAKRNLAVTDKSHTSGLCWEDDERRLQPGEGAQEADFYHKYKIGMLLGE